MNNFFLIVGKNGTFEPEDAGATNDPINGVFVKPEDIDQLFSLLDAQGTTKLAIHFHGGLVNQSSGINAAKNMAQTFSSAGSFPVAFIWKTGILEIAKQEIVNSQSAPFFEKLKKIIIKQAAKRLGLQVGARGIEVFTEEELNAELQKEEPFSTLSIQAGARSTTMNSLSTNQTNFEAELEADLEGELEGLALSAGELKTNENPHLNLSKISDRVDDGRKGLISTAKLVSAATKIIVRIVKRFMNGKDHGLYCTAIEELYRELYIDSLGQIIWGGIKNKASDMWIKDNPSTQGLNQHAGYYFIKKLNEFFTKYPSATLDLVGHSAGSIVICHMLNALKIFPAVNIRTVIFLAPACHVNLFKPFITNGTPFENFYLFTMADDYEKKDRLVPVLYPHSLLYFISGLLEAEADEPILGMHRHFNAVPGQEQFLIPRSILSVTDGNNQQGRKSNSTRHSDFDNDEITLESIGILLN